MSRWENMPTVLVGYMSQFLCLEDVLTRISLVCSAWEAARKHVLDLVAKNHRLSWYRLCKLFERSSVLPKHVRSLVMDQRARVVGPRKTLTTPAADFLSLCSVKIKITSDFSQITHDNLWTFLSCLPNLRTVDLGANPTGCNLMYTTTDTIKLSTLTRLTALIFRRYDVSIDIVEVLKTLVSLDCLQFHACLLNMTVLVDFLNSKPVSELVFSSCTTSFDSYFGQLFTKLDIRDRLRKFTCSWDVSILGHSVLRDFFERNGEGLEELHLTGPYKHLSYFLAYSSLQNLRQLTGLGTSIEQDWIGLATLIKLESLVLQRPALSKGVPRRSKNGNHFCFHLVSLKRLRELSLDCDDFTFDDLLSVVSAGLTSLQSVKLTVVVTQQQRAQLPGIAINQYHSKENSFIVS